MVPVLLPPVGVLGLMPSVLSFLWEKILLGRRVVRLDGGGGVGGQTEKSPSNLL